MGYIEGLLGGFTERKREREIENLRAAEIAGARESRIYETLLSSPDPEIQSLAAAGLIESAQPKRRKRGIRGWLGEMEQSPLFSQLQSLIATPVQTSPGEIAQLPSTQYPTIPTPPPSLGEAPAGTPAQSITEPGAPPPVRPQPTQIPGRVATPPSFGPRRIFPSAEDAAVAAARGKARGDVEGEVAGLVASGIPEAEARELIKADYLRRATTGAQSIAGEVVNADGTVTPAFAVFDRTSQQYINPQTRQPMQGFRPRSATGSVSMGADREAIARELFGRPFAQLTQAQQGQVNQQAITRTQDVAFQRGMGTGRARIQTELNMPIGPSNARLFNVSPTTTLAELSGTVGLTDEQKDRLYAVGQIDLLIDDIDTLIPQVFPNVPEGIKGSVRTALSLGMQRFAGDQDLAKLDAAINAALAQVAQLSGQPGSRLSDRDIELAKSTLASLQPSLFGGDTINTARARVGVIKNLLDKARTSIPTTPQIGAAPPAAGAPARGGPPVRAATPPPSGARAVKQGDSWVIQVP